MNSTSKTPTKKKSAKATKAVSKKKTSTAVRKRKVKVEVKKVKAEVSKPSTSETLLHKTPKPLSIENKPKFLAENYYLPAREFISPELSDFLYRQLLMKVERGEFVTDQQSPDQPAWAGETFLDAILLENLKKAEELVGYELYPTYSYARMYGPGAILEPHKDRPACEVSFTCTVGFEGDPSALFFCKDVKEDEELPAGELTNEEIERERLSGTPTKMILSTPGDAAVYLGCKIIHWREPIENTRSLAQLFMHYVAKNGPNSSQKYDGRPPNFFLKGPLD